VCETVPRTREVGASQPVSSSPGGSAAGAGAATAAEEQPLLLAIVQRAPPSGYGASNKFMGLPLTFTLPRSTTGRELTALVASKLRRYQKDPAGAPPPEAGGDTAGADAESATSSAVASGGGGVLLGSALHGGAALEDDGSSSPTAVKPASAVRSAQWKLFYSTMAAGSFGYESLGAPVPLSDEPCEFTPPSRASSYGSSSSYGASSSDAAKKIESRHVVLEWQSTAFAARGHYERAKVEADEAEKAGIGCGRTPVGERGPAAGGGGVALTACLELFSRDETLDAENAWFCDRCKEHREASKKLQIWSLPSILVVHLKRFSAQGMWRRKNDTPVDFPFEIDLAPYCLQQAEPGESLQTVYELIAVSNHYGSTGGGHYTAFARHSESGQWHKFDDSHTAVVEAKDVVTPAAYVLMYGRRNVAARAEHGSPERE